MDYQHQLDGFIYLTIHYLLLHLIFPPDPKPHALYSLLTLLFYERAAQPVQKRCGLNPIPLFYERVAQPV
jgi:hypothetical protein